MTFEQLGNTGELIAALATLATLAYLALQIRQSNRGHQLAAVSRMAESTEGWLDKVIENEQLLDVYLRGMRDYDALDRDERARFALLIMRFLRGVESAWLQIEWGLVDDEHWAGFKDSLLQIVGSEGGRRALERSRSQLNPRFSQAIDEILENGR